MNLRNDQILVGELLDDPKARGVLQKRFGKFLNHPMVPAARSLTLEQLVGFAKVYLPKRVIEETLRDLRSI